VLIDGSSNQTTGAPTPVLAIPTGTAAVIIDGNSSKTIGAPSLILGLPTATATAAVIIDGSSSQTTGAPMLEVSQRLAGGVRMREDDGPQSGLAPQTDPKRSRRQ
jgi:hypothetical protein